MPSQRRELIACTRLRRLQSRVGDGVEAAGSFDLFVDAPYLEHPIVHADQGHRTRRYRHDVMSSGTHHRVV